MTAPDRECWNCAGVDIETVPDPAMRGLTDSVRCTACGEEQE